MSSILSTVVRSVVDKVLETMFDDLVSAVKGGVVVKYAVKILNTYMSTSDDSMVQKARAKVLNCVEMMLDKLTTVADGILDKENRAEILKVAEMMLDLLTSLAVKGAVDKVLENIFDESTTAADGSLDKKSKTKKSNGIADILIKISTTSVARSVVEKILAIASDELGKRNEEETTKAVESKTDETPQELVEALQEELQESRQREC
ncbi:uncharacterized protein [Taeniopygia guttata]|uniref:uncharacterized protein isoform X2 n=1 Tax=Taeniopygia guttata TaxID=59729 RepID=UPI003BB8FA56